MGEAAGFRLPLTAEIAAAEDAALHVVVVPVLAVAPLPDAGRGHPEADPVHRRLAAEEAEAVLVPALLRAVAGDTRPQALARPRLVDKVKRRTGFTTMNRMISFLELHFMIASALSILHLYFPL